MQSPLIAVIHDDAFVNNLAEVCFSALWRNRNWTSLCCVRTLEHNKSHSMATCGLQHATLIKIQCLCTDCCLYKPALCLGHRSTLDKLVGLLWVRQQWEKHKSLCLQMSLKVNTAMPSLSGPCVLLCRNINLVRVLKNGLSCLMK